MNLPAYVLQDGQQAAVNLRVYLPTIGVSFELYRHWVSSRIQELELVEGQHYQLHKEGQTKKHIVTFPALIQLLGIGRFKALREQQQVIYALMDALKQQGFQLPDHLAEFKAELPNLTDPSPAPAISRASAAIVPVLQIEGRAAVNVLDLFKLWNPQTETRMPQWFLYHINKLGFVLGKHYVEYNEPPTAGHRRGTTGYIVSIDAAIAIAENEAKGKGQHISQYLIGFRKELAKQRLSTKGSLADFIGLKPAVQPDPDTSGSPSAQVKLFDNNPTSEASSPPIEHQTGEVDESNREDAPAGDDSLPQQQEVVHQTDQPSDTAAEPRSDLDSTLPTESTQLPSAATLMLQMAQLLLQQAQLLVDQEQRLTETTTTVSQIVAIGQQSALQTLGLSTGGQQPPQQTMRSRIRQIVNSRCRKTGEFQDQVYAFIYNRLYYLYGISVTAHHKAKDESYLELCERLGILEKVYAIVNSHEFTIASNAAPLQPRGQAA
ncbi:hypothetical protein GCM10027299_03260 [Larkinella ripae]